MPGLFEQYNVNPNEVMRRPNGRPTGTRDGMGQRRQSVANPQLQGMQYTQAPVAQPSPQPMPQPAPRPAPFVTMPPAQQPGIMPVQPMMRPGILPTQPYQQMGLNPAYATGVMNKYGMRGY